jgi:hypothetical protein
LKKYEIKVEGEESAGGSNFLVRKSRIKSENKSTFSVTKAFPYDEFTLDKNQYYINEAFMRGTDQDLIEMYKNKSKSEDFIRLVKTKVRSKKFNIPFLDINWTGQISDERFEKVAGIITDTIYGNTNIDLINPPKLSFPNSIDEHKRFDYYISFLKILGSVMRDTFGENRMSCFIPEYFSFHHIENLINFYVENNGADGLFVVDNDGKTFTSKYANAFFVMRTLRRLHKSEGFALYCYNTKASKRSGNAVPSEDFLAFYNGFSFVGQSHRGVILPKKIRDELQTKLTKLIYRDDLLYYPYNKSANDGPYKDLESWRSIFSKETKVTNSVLKKYNAVVTDNVLKNFREDPNSVLMSLKRHQFSEELAKLGKARDSVMNNKPLNDFL